MVAGAKRRRNAEPENHHPIETVLELQNQEGPMELVKGLTEHWGETIRILLQVQSAGDLKQFNARLKTLFEEGYQLTSLVAVLRCAPDGGAQKWTWEVRPKIGAKPRIHLTKRVFKG